eukprot:6713517-Pyramimonas_sp.AAC.1
MGHSGAGRGTLFPLALAAAVPSSTSSPYSLLLRLHWPGRPAASLPAAPGRWLLLKGAASASAARRPALYRRRRRAPRTLGASAAPQCQRRGNPWGNA